jgi:hypothetical protein
MELCDRVAKVPEASESRRSETIELI